MKRTKGGIPPAGARRRACRDARRGWLACLLLVHPSVAVCLSVLPTRPSIYALPTDRSATRWTVPHIPRDLESRSLT